MLQCRMSQNVHYSCVASTVVVFKPKYGTFILQGQVCGMVEALPGQRASKESKQHLNVVSTIVQRLNLYLNSVQVIMLLLWHRGEIHPSRNSP